MVVAAVVVVAVVVVATFVVVVAVVAVVFVIVVVVLDMEVANFLNVKLQPLRGGECPSGLRHCCRERK